MSHDLAALADHLTDVLALNAPPIAITYVTSAPAGVATFTGSAPAGCALWRHAENSTFFADASCHRSCVVGMHTQGLALDEAAGEELMGLIGQMGELGYLAGTEVPAIPTVPNDRTGPSGGIVYGPLRDVATTCDAVAVWVDARQAMLLNEATGGAAWGSHGPAVFGRPACAAIPAAMKSGAPTISLGCAGMRTFTEIADHKMLVVLPARCLDDLSAALGKTGAANDSMGEFYRARKTAAAATR